MELPDIYYVVGAERRGPVSLAQFAELGLDPATLVWYNGLAEWTRADNAPLTAALYVRSTPYPRPGCPNDAYPPQKPDNYLVWAILATLFCCLPAGIVSIVYAAQVNSAYRRGDYDEAERYSRNARTWAIVSAVAALVYIFIMLISGISLTPYSFLYN